jgi:hypothetical protein
VGNANNRETKLAALKARIVPVAKSADLLAVARELEAIGTELAGEERPERPAGEDAWPRDLNEGPQRTAAEWGNDPDGDVHG